jgi:RNA polymerase sigma factor (sigma-70 family)
MLRIVAQAPTFRQSPASVGVEDNRPERERKRVPATDAASVGWERVVQQLVSERGDALTRYAYFVSGSRDDAADLVQDALVKTFGRLRNGFSVASAEAYVRRAILNTFIDGGRRGTRWRGIAHLEAVPSTLDSPAAATDAAIDLHAELRKLSPRERACLVLRYYEDLKVDDIAATLELSSGAVKRYLSDGLAKMAIAIRSDELADLAEDANGTGAQHAS